MAGRAHEVAGNAGTVPSTLSKAVCDHSESTHPAEILKSSLACGHKIPQLGIYSTPRAPLRHESHAKNGGRRPSPLQNQNARRLTQKLRTEPLLQFIDKQYLPRQDIRFLKLQHESATFIRPPMLFVLHAPSTDRLTCSVHRSRLKLFCWLFKNMKCVTPLQYMSLIVPKKRQSTKNG